MIAPGRFATPLFAALLVACSSNAGTGSASLPSMLPNAPPAASATAASSYLYVENNNSTIAAYSVGEDGSLSPVKGSPYASHTTSPGKDSIAVDPLGPYLLVTGTQSDTALFSIEAKGGLKFLRSSNAQTGSGFPLFADSYKRLYILNTVNGGSIGAFGVASGNGRLRNIAGSPFGVGCPGFCTSNPTAMVISKGYLYSIDTYGWYVSAFSIASNGALTELNSYATHYGPNDGAMTPDGAYLYVTNGASADISAYGVAHGVLTQLTGSPFRAGGTPIGIAISPNGKFAYVADNADATISGYSVKADGRLAALAGSPFGDGSGTSPTSLAIDKSGKHLIVTNAGTENVAVYTIEGSGRIAQIKGSPFGDAGGLSPQGAAFYYP